METREPTTAVRTFQLEYARFRMLAEAEVMGVENPGIEFWLLGLLHLASVSDYRMDIFSTPQVGWEDKLQARSRIRQELASRGIIASRLGSILRTLLSQGAESDPDLVESHLAADDLLLELLDRPTDTIAQAIMRLQLLTVLKSFRDTLEATTEIGAVTEDQRAQIIKQSRLWGRYDNPIDRESAYEILVAATAEAERQKAEIEAQEKAEKEAALQAKEQAKAEKEAKKKAKNSIASKVLKSIITAVTGVVAASVADSVSGKVSGTKKKSTTSTTKKAVQKATRSATNTITKELTRSILGNLIK